MPVTLASIAEARDRIAGVVRTTPLWPSRALSGRASLPVHLKCEQLQRTGSFKARGALNFVLQMGAADAKRGLVAMSAGNHAQGVALAAQARGIDATIVMPAYAPLAKRRATAAYGATVIASGESLDEARAIAQAIAAEQGKLFVPPFDHDHIIAGQGTGGLEILEQLPDVATVVVPAGGGGLLAGVAVAVKESRPSVRVVGVQSGAMPGIVASLRAGQLTRVEPRRTLADGVAVSGPSERTFALIQRYVDDVVTVPEESIADAMVFLLERARLVTEGAGALAVAALLGGAVRPSAGPCVAVLSGGNVDINTLGAVVRHGLSDAGRYQRLTVEVADTPGQLAMLTAILATQGANVLEVEHNRELPGLPIGVAAVELLLEVEDVAHHARVLDALAAAGVGERPGFGRLATAEARLRHVLA